MKDPTNFVVPKRLEAHKKERTERGFSEEDWWNFDTYIAWVIAGAVEKMKADGNTMFAYPGEPEENWSALTHGEYEIMAKGFSQWADADNYLGDADSLYRDLEDALEIFKNRFKSLWD